jgi:hypothetical protein
MLEALREEFAFTLTVIDIDADAELLAAFRCQIPVVTIDGGNRVALRVTPQRVRRAFRQAGARRNKTDKS